MLISSFTYCSFIIIIWAITAVYSQWGNLASEVASEFDKVDERLLALAKGQLNNADVILNGYYNDTLSDSGRTKCLPLIEKAKSVCLDCVRELYTTGNGSELKECISGIVTTELMAMIDINAEERSLRNGAVRLDSILGKIISIWLNLA